MWKVTCSRNRVYRARTEADAWAKAWIALTDRTDYVVVEHNGTYVGGYTFSRSGAVVRLTRRKRNA